MLEEDGLLYLEVPSYDIIERDLIWMEFTKDHRTYWKKRTLAYLLINNGFEIEEIYNNEEDLCLTVIAKKLSKEKNLFKMRKKIEKDLLKFKDSINYPFAVFGGGHYSQLILSLFYSRYGIKPVRIFDSNKQKCGNKICNVLIEHEDALFLNEDFNQIIIIAGIYNDEIYEKLKKLNYKGEILKWN